MCGRWRGWGWCIRSRTAEFYGGPNARAKVEDAALGYYEALIEARIPFEMVHDGLLDEEHLRQYRTLILPNIAALSTKQCEQIRAFVERGWGRGRYVRGRRFTTRRE